MIVTLIIPFYNVDEYIEKCLSTVVQQTYKDLQIILVNDGSQDGSHHIAKTFAVKDDRICIVEQANQGLSAARNAGLNYVKGDYVFFLDSDDYLEEFAIEILLNKAIKYNADVVQGNFYYDYKNHLLLNTTQKHEDVVYHRAQAIHALLDHTVIMNFAWGKLIKTSIAKSLLFPVGKFFEDTLWQTQLIHQSTIYVTTNIPILYYLQRGTGISGNFSLRNLDQLEGEHNRLIFIKEHYPVLLQKALQKFYQKVILYNKLIIKLSTDEQLVFEDQIAYYLKLWELQNRFKFVHFISNQRFLSVILKIYLKLENVAFGQQQWLKISKEHNKSNS